jgi:hypothetical protein
MTTVAAVVAALAAIAGVVAFLLVPDRGPRRPRDRDGDDPG